MYPSSFDSFAKAASSTPPCSVRLARARSRSCSTFQPDFATPMTGQSRLPRFTMLCSAGKIFLYARSPVAPKNTRASETGGFPELGSADAIGVLLAIPEGDASEKTLDVGHDPDLRRQRALDLPSVAAPDVQPVVVEERVEGGDGLAEALV